MGIPELFHMFAAINSKPVEKVMSDDKFDKLLDDVRAMNLPDMKL